MQGRRLRLASPSADMASGDVTIASLGVLYLRGRSFGFPAALLMMVAIGASRGTKVRRRQGPCRSRRLLPEGPVEQPPRLVWL